MLFIRRPKRFDFPRQPTNPLGMLVQQRKSFLLLSFGQSAMGQTVELQSGVPIGFGHFAPLNLTLESFKELQQNFESLTHIVAFLMQS